MSYSIRVREGKSIGRAHLLAGKNRQDAMKTGSVKVYEKTFYYGFICDGCSEGFSSEIGAGLAVEYLSRQTEILVKQKVETGRIPIILHKRLVGFLREILGRISFDSAKSRVEYIKDNLLFTVLGFIFTDSDKESVIMAQGDGVYIVNDTLTIREENDTPHYVGYELVDRKFLMSNVSTLQTSFDVLAFPGNTIKRLAIASDALTEELEFTEEIWGQVNQSGLQRRVNVWSLNNHKFQDDLSIITLEKIAGNPVETLL